MDQIKVGKFIQQLRKEKNITQEQLAEKLFLNSRSISKWERGENLPDIENIKKLSEIFEVSQEEIMNGERKKSKKEIRKEKIKSFVKKYKLIIIPFILINIILYILLAIFFINNYNKVTIYDVRTEGEDFSVEGTITVGKKFTYIDLSNIKLIDNYKMKKAIIMTYRIIKDNNEDMVLFASEHQNLDENGNGMIFNLNDALVGSSIHMRTSTSDYFDFEKDKLYYHIWILDENGQEVEHKEKLVFSKIES